MLSQHICSRNFNLMKECCVFRIHSLWKEWMETGIKFLNQKSLTKALFYLNNARGISVFEFLKPEITPDAIIHLTGSALLVARTYRRLDEFTLEQTCLYETFEIMGYRLQEIPDDREVSHAMRILVNKSYHDEYLSHALEEEAIEFISNK